MLKPRSPLRPILRSASLADRVYETLREHFRSGAIGRDQPLREALLAQQLGVSRTPLREALARLASEGFIQVDGRSFAVSARSEEDIDEIYELRMLLETEAIRSAATAPERDVGLAGVRRALRAAESAHLAADAKAFIAANREFRDSWLAMVRNRRLAQAVERYADHVRALQVSTLDDRARQRIVLAGMKKISNAIAAGDADAASRAMREYLGVARAAMATLAGRQTQSRSAA